MPPPSMSTRTLLAGTNKMSITCGYLHRAGLRPRRRLQLLQHQRLRQQPRLRLQLLPQPLLRPQLLLLPGRRRRRGLSLRRDRAPRHAHGRSYRRSVAVLAVAAPRQSEAATREIFHRVRGAKFSDQSSHRLLGDNSRQNCCSGLGKRALATVRDPNLWNRESPRRFNASLAAVALAKAAMLQPLHTL